MCPSVAGTRMPNADSGLGFRCPEKAGRNVAPLSRAASRIRNLVNSPETVNSGTFDSPVVYSAVRLPTSPTQITDATGQRYFVQMARWRIVHTNEDPPDRINRAPQHHEYVWHLELDHQHGKRTEGIERSAASARKVGTSKKKNCVKN